ncbi:MAG: COX15/CtaA family protein [Chloroflexota bacterium]|nr:COX15/CtaA family protein [Chloroflexota bacterium]MDE2908709.1 COX15/CtaA family protein [Chloroflexota bacterium]
MVDHSVEAARSSTFVILSLSTAALTLGLIVFGAVVRVTESGLGCGTDWPLCNGTIFPPLDNITAWIEWLHRLFALLIGFFGLATLAAAWRSYRQDNRRVLRMTIAAAILFVAQSALGAIVVFLELPPTFVTLHLGVAMLLLAALLGAAVLAWRLPTPARHSDSIPLQAAANAAMAFVVILTGALVRGSGATLACTTWPLCDGGVILPVAQGQLAIINMIHRLSVAAMSVALFILIWQVHRYRTEPLTRRIALGAAVTHIVQIVAGALFVLSSAGREWGALHVGLAAAVWGLLVTLAIMEGMNREGLETGNL